MNRVDENYVLSILAVCVLSMPSTILIQLLLDSYQEMFREKKLDIQNFPPNLRGGIQDPLEHVQWTFLRKYFYYRCYTEVQIHLGLCKDQKYIKDFHSVNPFVSLLNSCKKTSDLVSFLRFQSEVEGAY